MIFCLIVSTSALGATQVFSGKIVCGDNIDLSDIEVEIYSSAPKYDEDGNFLYYVETYERSVYADADGDFEFVKPSLYCSYTINVETLPANYGVSKHTQFIIPTRTNDSVTIAAISTAEADYSGGSFYAIFKAADGTEIYTDHDIIEDGESSVFVAGENLSATKQIISAENIEDVNRYTLSGTIVTNGKNYRYSKSFDISDYSETEKADLLCSLGKISEEEKYDIYSQYGEEFYSFVNGQHTTQGGTHQAAFREALSRTIKEFFNKNFEYADIRNGIVAAISVKVVEPIFESQTKIRLGSTVMYKDGPTIYKFINDFMKKELDNFLHKEPHVAEVMLRKITESEKERKAMAGVTKIARERAKKVALHNRKLRDCRVHFNDNKGDKRAESMIFITEGDSASGSITKIRDVETQAVFSLRGKPLNSFGKTQKVVYENEEFNLLQAALNIEGGIDGLRYNKVIIATDADVDGMHIRLLMLTFLLQFFPELIKTGHVYILQTPLFRVRNKKEAKRKSRKSGTASQVSPETYYCYTEEERLAAIEKLGENAEITRFKGLGEISPEEFKGFIGEDMRLDRVSLRKEDSVKEMLEFYMGKNTMERQNFIIDNLVVEEDEELQ